MDLVNDEFPEAKQEAMETFAAIAQSIRDGDLDKLISYHAYSPKFTEFKNGEPRNSDEAPDPYYGGENGFENVFSLLDQACDLIVKELQK
ncbi:MAG: hypothetical protein KJO00_09570 [Bacteroidia bacterium]|nr:hypothetical protein [Bacteroidia bacterium]MBT8288257.1 hypothetical protein [Bacteroidia bacterium]NNK74168.1 hypothetical protein [Flavobacteriaceae bacterium]